MFELSMSDMDVVIRPHHNQTRWHASARIHNDVITFDSIQPTLGEFNIYFGRVRYVWFNVGDRESSIRKMAIDGFPGEADTKPQKI